MPRPRSKTFTDDSIKRLAYRTDGPSTQVHYDPGLRGFGVRVYAGGSKSYVVRVGEGTTRRLIVLGDVGRLSLDGARAEALRLLQEARGVDDVAVGLRPTVAEVVAHYLANHRTRKLGRPAGEAVDVRTRMTSLATTLGTKRLADVTEADARRWAAESKGPVEQNRRITYARALWNYAAKRSWVPDRRFGPFDLVQRNRERPRDVAVGPDELRALWRAIDGERDVVLRGAFKAMIGLGMRCGERQLLSLQWDWLDFDNNVITNPDDKSGDLKRLPMSSTVADALRAIPRVHGSPYVFHSPTAKSGHIGPPRKSWVALLKRAKVRPDLRMMDLRRSVQEVAREAGLDHVAIAVAVGHADASTGLKHYRRRDADRGRPVVEHIAAIVEPPAKRKGARR